MKAETMRQDARQLRSSERLIVALDVPTHALALQLVDELDGVVSFYKIGLELFLAGALEDLLERLGTRSVFLDLKMPGDIGETIRRAITLCVHMGVRFVTLSSSAGPQTIGAAREARGSSLYPQLLMVPLLSSMDETDLHALSTGARDQTLEEFLKTRSREALEQGCDGLVVSGTQIRTLRQEFPDAVLVSPGIRPAWCATTHDHKRHTTPADAIAMGADYLVVGRPIRDAGNRPQAAQRIIDEIDKALTQR